MQGDTCLKNVVMQENVHFLELQIIQMRSSSCFLIQFISDDLEYQLRDSKSEYLITSSKLLPVAKSAAGAYGRIKVSFEKVTRHVIGYLDCMQLKTFIFIMR